MNRAEERRDGHTDLLAIRVQTAPPVGALDRLPDGVLVVPGRAGYYE